MVSFKRHTAVLLSLAILFSLLPRPCGAESASAVPTVAVSGISARSAILIEATAGSRRVLWEQNADERLGPASTTKIMTALVALERMPVSTVVTVPPEAVGVEGSSLYLCEGERLTLENLLYGILLQSANDAAAAAAIAVGGSIGEFAELMNEKAARLGLRDTHFANPHGLDADEHYTSAHDLALIAAEALDNELFHAIVSTYRKEIAAPDGGTPRLLINHNRLLRSYDGCVGVKTGYTRATGRCLVSAAERGGIRLIAVTLDDGDDWNDHCALLDAGFAAVEAVDLSAIFRERLLPVAGGEQTGVLCRAEVPETVVLPLPHGSVECRIELPRLIFAPVYAGTRVGRVSFWCDGRELCECEIRAVYSAARRQNSRILFGKKH